MSVKHLRERNLEKAISGYKKALKVLKKAKSSVEHSEVLVLMGNAYGTLAEVRDKEKNAKLAIAAFKAALVIFTKDSYPEYYKLVSRNLSYAQSQLTNN